MKLEKKLGFLSVFAIAAGAMISSGLFVLPALAYSKCGPGVFLAYMVASLLILPAMLSQSELATAMPKAGGTYFFIDRTLGPVIGTLGGVSNWFSLSLKSAFALVGLGVLCELIVPGLSYAHVKLIAVAFLLLFVVLNILGVELAARAQVTMVLALLVILFLYTVVAVPKLELTRFVPLLPHGNIALFATAGFVFVSFGGLTKIASIAEEIQDPSRTIPMAMFVSWFIVGLLYAATVFVTVGVVPAQALAATHTPLAIGAEAVVGKPGLIALGIGGILAVLTTANSGIMAASRSPMAMSRDGILPACFSRVSPRFGTPLFAIGTTGVFMLLVIVFLDLEHLVEAASALMLLLFMLVNLCVIVMRESRVPNYRPAFRSPLYPWVQIVGLLGPAILLVTFGAEPLLITLGFLLLALLWYWVYARPRASREYGFLHLVERLVSRHLSQGLLRKELRQIVLERDDIVEDRFDHLVHSCPILDLDAVPSTDELFTRVSDMLAEPLDMTAGDIKDLLWERERESSTALAPGLAVPHIIVPGEKKFDLVLVRARQGVVFEKDQPPVVAVFVLIGSRDERNFHLKALAAIAQIVQNKDFDEKWRTARGPEELRDVILLAERRRA